MPTAEALVGTEHPERYLTQLCQHAGKVSQHAGRRHRPHAGGPPPEILRAECTGSDGVVTLTWGRWSMHAAPGALMLRAEAGDPENLQRIQDLVTTRLETIGRRDHLTVNWHPADRDAS